MPQLILFRHAQAEPSGKDTPLDRDRVLTATGRADASEAGRSLANLRLAIDAVLCSPSARTRQTWDEALRALAAVPPPRLLEELFDAQDTYLDILRREGGSAEALVVVGHNPVIQATAADLSAGAAANAGAGNDPGRLFPTAAFAVFDFEGAWRDLGPGSARLTGFKSPSAASAH